MKNAEILIVGAGPTGLVLALWLTKIGVSVRIIDKADREGTTSRALVMHARNLEFYNQMNIDKIFLEHGLEFKVANLWIRGKKVEQLPFGNLGSGISPYPYILIIPQDVHEKLLIEQLKILGVNIERSTELISFKTSPDRIYCLLQKNGKQEQYETRYVAGCDGGHSIVRDEAGIGFPGGTYSDIFYVADIEGSGPVADGNLHISLDEADFLAIFPMKGKGKMRLVGAVRQEQKENQNLKWEDVSDQEIIRRMKITVEKVNWFSTYHVHHRVASHFQKGRVFILGDAAHVHSPVGGQGMNTGIGDAVNLAWKLGAVLKGTAPATLLDTYEPERIAFARKLVATTDRAFSFANARGNFATWVRLHIIARVLSLLFRLTSVRRFMFRTLSQTAIKYPQSPLSAGSVGSIKGGDRLPWVKTDGTDNYKSLTSMQWQIHCYGEMTQNLKDWCNTKHFNFTVFPWNKTVKNAGLNKNAVYIIRPDGYIGLAEHTGDVLKIANYLDSKIIFAH